MTDFNDRLARATHVRRFYCRGRGYTTYEILRKDENEIALLSPDSGNDFIVRTDRIRYDNNIILLGEDEHFYRHLDTGEIYYD